MNDGKYITQTRTIHHDAVEEQEEIWHYETLREYPNGGKDLIKIIDQEYVAPCEEYDEEITEEIFVPYTEEELTQIQNQNRIAELKLLLAESDYKTIKYFEGYLTDEEYEPTRQLRQSYREEINQLEGE